MPIHADNQMLGKRLRTLRINKNISQENVAATLEITQSAYSKIERGDRKITVLLVQKLSEIYHLDFQILIAYCNGHMSEAQILSTTEFGLNK